MMNKFNKLSLLAAIALAVAIPAKSAPPTTVYAGGPKGVFRSTDGGVTWTQLLSGVIVGSLAIDPLNPQVIYAGTGEAVYKTTNGGTHWTQETSGLTSAGSVSVLQIDPTNTNIIYAATGTFGTGVYKSTDAGVHWSLASNGLTHGPNGELWVTALALDPLNPNTLYAAGNTGFNPAKTTNGASSWSPISYPSAGFAAAVNPVQNATVFIGGFEGTWRSTDSGTTWIQTLTTSPYANTGVLPFTDAIAIDPNTPATMYAGDEGCLYSGVCSSVVYRSTDTGATWTPIGTLEGTLLAETGTEEVRALAIDPANPATLYAGGDTGVWQSKDGGFTWTKVYSPGTGNGNGIFALAMLPNAAQNAAFNAAEAIAKAVIAVAGDFKNFPNVACGILAGYLNQISFLVRSGEISSGQGQALTAQIQAAEATLGCPGNPLVP